MDTELELIPYYSPDRNCQLDLSYRVCFWDETGRVHEKICAYAQITQEGTILPLTYENPINLQDLLRMMVKREKHWLFTCDKCGYAECGGF